MSGLTLPDALRGAFKEPLGPVFADAEELLAAADAYAASGTAADTDEDGDEDARAPLVAVGDVVTYHLRRADRDPDVAVVDGKTEREAVGAELRRILRDGNRRIAVTNPPATLSDDLLDALGAAVAADENVVIHVDGEEDLAALPALLVVPAGGSVVYGQPGEGMVLVRATPDARERARDLLSRMDGDVAAAFERLGV